MRSISHKLPICISNNMESQSLAPRRSGAESNGLNAFLPHNLQPRGWL